MAIEHAGSTACDCVTVSIGGCTTIASLETSQALIEAADGQLYQAKRLGRHCVCWAGR